MSGKLRAAIIGSTGYGGVELIRLLLQHPQVEIASVISSSSAGALYADGYPHLSEIITDKLEAIDVEAIQGKADVVFLATPHGVSTELSPKLIEAGLKVIDVSGDLRLKQGDVYEKWYKHKPASPEFLSRSVYGLCELFAGDVKGADLIANPGCFPTATSLGLAPLLAEGWIDSSTIVCDAKTGVSGAGRGLGQMYHYSEINESTLAYKVNRHQHTPEIEQTLSRVAGHEVTITFTAHLLPMTRGILVTSYAKLTSPKTDEDVLELFRHYYEGRPFVRIRPAGKWPATKEVYGSNYCDIGVSVDTRTNRVTVISVIDNLVKGAAGQAVQNLNLMMGWDETTGLAFTPVYP
ncbi:MAG: N-acetyl-gamma-glutamyl-phosphate reductase [Paenibacillus sp.]|jgi:N-acetyl-gamma-glutamyl-phosphate reductase|nr:N-acetyl-gamma-glutamyl-phosphate reductase [Paenibacillus sp.]